MEKIDLKKIESLPVSFQVLSHQEFDPNVGTHPTANVEMEAYRTQYYILHDSQKTISKIVNYAVFLPKT